MTELKPYAEYNDSRTEFLDEVPAHWVVQPAVTLARIVTSTVDKKSYDGGVSVRLCNYTDVYYNDVINASDSYMSATATADQIRSFSVRAGDVVITKDSETSDDIGISAFVTATLPGVVYGYHLSIYQPHDRRYGKFLKWLFDSRYVKSALEVRTPGVTRVGLSQNTLRYLRVPTPQADEAQGIADFLDKETAEIDAFIADQDQLIALLGERKAAAGAHAFAGVVQVESRKRAAAAIPLGVAISEVDGRVGNAVRDLLSVSIHHGVVPWNSIHSTPPTANNFEKYKIAEIDNVVLNRMRAFQGAVGLVRQSGMVSPDYAVFQVRSGFAPGYLAQLLRSHALVEAIKLRLRGIGDESSGAIRTPRINSRDLVRIRVVLPDLMGQQQVVEHLDRETSEIDAAIEDANQAIVLSQERRAALISAAVTGKIDVRGLVRGTA